MQEAMNILFITIIKLVAVLAIFSGIALFAHGAVIMGLTTFFVGFSTLGLSEVEDKS